MDARLQRRVQRYGWDLAAARYEALWRAPLAAARAALLQQAALVAGEQVLDVACGTGLVALRAARSVGAAGRVVGVDVSGRMVDAARARAGRQRHSRVTFERMDAEALELPDAGFDAVLCAFGLMYLPDPHRALREMLRVLRPAGRLGLAVWGERSRCGWSALFGIVDAEVRTEVCPLFFRLGSADTLARLCVDAGCRDVRQRRIGATLDHASADDACDAAFVGGPVALAWSRFDAAARTRVRQRYAETIEPWRDRDGYRIPAEFVVVTAAAPGDRAA
jgi:ubiquinone/menaquinone biosynthesis C-methylase UbiE